MSEILSPEQLTKIQNYDSEKRLSYFIKEVVTHSEVWILTDEHGCVMLNSDDEDCVPVWPSEQFASLWATGDWKACEPKSISLNKWHSRWTVGLEDDELAVAVFPNQSEEGVVISPDELDFELRKQSKK
ncbi:DUF2750 domain-containing protein [Vibrio sp. SS-MA-C1-2]|uniref:DUF2750 domain-containing protein n=1 Tax=Vibrio sp. SS-MA-C1-2 TaxID=2908646 RepID=UPI001F22E504|nr:DUF2750 domain-containing protein [Vibrio sp. SS-MA-C1-2]UJF19953.1 DUF2750 domain-containing protein [Vibrio sp. SS-MA-C1-2]